MSKLLILQAVATDYRKKLFDTLKNSLKNDFKLYAGDVYFERSIKTDKKIVDIHKVKNFYLLNRKFLFQFGMWKESLQAETLIIELNPRVLSNWILLLLRKISGKKTLLWGHAWPRKGKDSKSDIVRQWMRTLADSIITYTKTQAQELEEKMPNKKIVYASNSLYYKDEMRAMYDRSNITDIIYVGRLIKAKKVRILIKAFNKIKNDLPETANLIIVGEGEEKNTIEKLVEKSGIGHRVKLTGHIGKYTELEKLYNRSLLSVSPGYVGLSITQSFGFGVPMVISCDENHSPEIEAAIEGQNSVYFKTDNVLDLSQKILFFYKKKDAWIDRREWICNDCKSKYSIEVMSNTFLELTK